jgi:hypothetical protein
VGPRAFLEKTKSLAHVDSRTFLLTILINIVLFIFRLFKYWLSSAKVSYKTSSKYVEHKLHEHTQKQHDTTISEKFRLRLQFNLKLAE